MSAKTFFKPTRKKKIKKLVIRGELSSLNEHDNANRNNRYAGAALKKKETERVFWECRSQKLTVILKPVKIDFNWYTKDIRKDPDNVSFAKKYILDGLIEAGVLVNDTREYIKGFTDSFHISKDNPRIEVIIK